MLISFSSSSVSAVVVLSVDCLPIFSILNFFRPCVFLRYRSVLIYLTIPLVVVHCIVAMLGLVSILVVKLNGRQIDVLLCHMNRKEICLIPIPLLAVPILLSNNFPWLRSKLLLVNAMGRIVLSLRFRHKIFPNPVRLTLVFTIWSRSHAKCAKIGTSFIVFFIVLKSSSSPSVHFQSDFCAVVVSFGRFPLKNWVEFL